MTKAQRPRLASDAPATPPGMSAFADILDQGVKPVPSSRYQWDLGDWVRCPDGYPGCYRSSKHKEHPTPQEVAVDLACDPDVVAKVIPAMRNRDVLVAASRPLASGGILRVACRVAADRLGTDGAEALTLNLLEIVDLPGSALEPLCQTRAITPEVALAVALHPRVAPMDVALLAITALTSRDAQVREALKVATPLSRACMMAAPLARERGSSGVLKAGRVLLRGCGSDEAAWEIVSALLGTWNGTVQEALVAVKLLRR